VVDEAVTPCGASKRCVFHRRSESKLKSGDIAWLDENLDIIQVVEERVWRRWCTCGLYDQIVGALARASGSGTPNPG
jgi:hypothetical protein